VSLLLPGFTCLECGGFTGTLKKPYQECRACGAPRPKHSKLVIVESPFAGDEDIVRRNIFYARVCLADCLSRGEAPFASHLLYPQVLDDTNAEERTIGIEAGLAWGDLAEATIVYDDFGISVGMQQGIERARAVGRPVEFRQAPILAFAIAMARWKKGAVP
jgi:hypothetical protein